MDYKVVVTRDAEEDLERFIKYLIFEKESMQAAENVLNDYDATIESLKHVLCYIALWMMSYSWIIFFMSCRIMKIRCISGSREAVSSLDNKM